MPRINPLVPSIEPSELSGVLVKPESTVETASHTISFSSKQGSEILPSFKAERRVFQDPEPRTFSDLAVCRTEQIHQLEDFMEALRRDIEENTPYLLPSKENLFSSLPKEQRVAAAYNQLVKTRIDKFFERVQIASRARSWSREEAIKILETLNRRYDEFFKKREFDFTSVSFPTSRHSRTYIHLLERMRNSYSPEDLNYTLLQMAIDDFYANDYTFSTDVDSEDFGNIIAQVDRDKIRSSLEARSFFEIARSYLYHTYAPIEGEVFHAELITPQIHEYIQKLLDNQLNLGFERKSNLRLIDAQTRKIISVQLGTEDYESPTYCVYQINPSSDDHHKGRYVYREGNNFFYQDTHEPMKSKRIQLLVPYVVNKVAAAPLFKNERSRTNFPFKRSQLGAYRSEERTLNASSIDEIKATLANLSLDLRNAGGVTEYRSSDNKVVEFTKEMQEQALVALLNWGTRYVDIQSQPVSHMSNHDFNIVYQPTRPKTSLVITTENHIQHTFSIQLESITNAPDLSRLARGEAIALNEFTPEQVFATSFPNEVQSALIPNPSVQRDNSLNIHFLKDAAQRRFVGSFRAVGLDAQGKPEYHDEKLDFNPFEQSEPILMLSSRLEESAGKRVIFTYLNWQTKELIESPVRYEPIPGGYQRFEEAPRSLGKVEDIMLGYEPDTRRFKILNDALKNNHRLYLKSQDNGESFEGVVEHIQMSNNYFTVSGNPFLRVDVSIQGAFGRKSMGYVLHRLNAAAQAVESYEALTPFEAFLEAPGALGVPLVTPLLQEGENVLVNWEMRQRNWVPVGQLKTSIIGILQTLSELVYVAASSGTPDHRYTIYHEGKRVVYTDKALWEADIKKLKQNEKDRQLPSAQAVGCGCFG